MRVRQLTFGTALVSSGLLAGAFGYGAVNVLYAFREVPLHVRFTFHTALMSVNGVVMQTLMGLTIVGCLALSWSTRGRNRLLATAAAFLAVTTFLITRFGNVPINQQIKQWAAGPVAGDYAQALSRWELFHVARVGTALVVFGLIVSIVLSAVKESHP
ncbi:hypothetical protein B0T36_23940 [Nocardia donostiensis]|uniref:DUF1772 domain-containing protein n=1 Tax=Nocardia donostiensis TaxID=1538463 RepID=UPI0009DA64DB|nr:DUF1772 domain-containing protein [Nocardia donostiensis]OQS12622.1 hypothetical protein B0T36_23940 [Nocardia donostiensis]